MTMKERARVSTLQLATHLSDPLDSGTSMFNKSAGKTKQIKTRGQKSTLGSGLATSALTIGEKLRTGTLRVTAMVNILPKIK